MISIEQAARTALADCLGLKPDETVLIVIDTSMEEIGKAFFTAARELGGEVALLEMIPRINHGVEPPPHVAQAMKSAQVVVALTSKSLSHTRARKEANLQGARIASMPGATADMLCRALDVDVNKLQVRSDFYADILTAGSQVVLTSPAGTDLTFSIAGRRGESDTGLYLKQGQFGNLPAGEAYIAPVEGTARGRLVIDGAMSGIGILSRPLVIEVEDGYATKITGGEEADRLEALLDKAGKAARNIAELGIGTNEAARLTGNVLEDEKVMGTVHIALGDNHTFGGVVEAPSHLDGIILRPTLVIDGKVIMENGNSCVNSL